MTLLKLGRKRDHRNRTIRNLATSLVLYEKLTTTEAKAKAVLPKVERLITIARRGDLAARRYAKSVLFDSNAVRKLFEDYPARLGGRTSGFVRLTKQTPRPGDGSSMAQLEVLLTPLEEIIAAETKTTTKVRRTRTSASKQTEEVSSNQDETPATNTKE